MTQRTRLYNIWVNMRQRCYNPNMPAYKDYGARGIRICKAWREYVDFAAWAMENGYSDHLTIDRKDNDKSYTSSNCRWVTQKVNNNNTRANSNLTAFGETKTIAEWANDHRCTVSDRALWKRVSIGWPAMKAITQPLRHGGGGKGYEAKT